MIIGHPACLSTSLLSVPSPSPLLPNMHVCYFLPLLTQFDRHPLSLLSHSLSGSFAVPTAYLFALLSFMYLFFSWCFFNKKIISMTRLLPLWLGCNRIIFLFMLHNLKRSLHKVSQGYNQCPVLQVNHQAWVQQEWNGQAHPDSADFSFLALISFERNEIRLVWTFFWYTHTNLLTRVSRIVGVIFDHWHRIQSKHAQNVTDFFYPSLSPSHT